MTVNESSDEIFLCFYECYIVHTYKYLFGLPMQLTGII